MRTLLIISLFCLSFNLQAQEDNSYKKRVLDKSELQILSSYYSQTGNNAAVTGGIGTEELTDIHPIIILTTPLNDDDVLTANLGVSAYSSASSSNVDPFGGPGSTADAFQATSGASAEDVWINLALSYSHSSDDRNRIWSANASVASEYDYFSIGGGLSHTWLMNEQNTELTVKANLFFDRWSLIYPSELRPFLGGDGRNDELFNRFPITGNPDYNPNFTGHQSQNRNSYNLGLNFSQVLSRNLQGSLSMDVVQQSGLLSTPFQRVYFADVDNSYIGDFALADDIERLPSSRTKIAVGGRLHAYLNERFVLRTFYRFYTDDWGINAHTLSLEIPVKILPSLTLHPAYRYYQQSAADHFAPFDQHQSSAAFYTSDYDLSDYSAHQFSLGLSYTDLLTNTRLFNWGLKSFDLNFSTYSRDSGLQAFLISGGIKLVRL